MMRYRCAECPGVQEAGHTHTHTNATLSVKLHTELLLKGDVRTQMTVCDEWAVDKVNRI